MKSNVLVQDSNLAVETQLDKSLEASQDKSRALAVGWSYDRYIVLQLAQIEIITTKDKDIYANWKMKLLMLNIPLEHLDLAHQTERWRST